MEGIPGASFRKYTAFGPDLLLITALFLVVLRLVTSLWLPLGYDHGMMAATGHTYLAGGVPYRDAWDMKGPVAFAGFALAELLFGRTMWGIRVLDAVVMAGASAVLGRFIASRTSPRYGLVCALGFLLAVASNGYFFTAQPDAWAAALSVFALVPLMRERAERPWRGALSAGVMIGLAGLIKPMYLALGVVVVERLAFRAVLPRSRRAGLVAAFGLAVALPIGLTIAYFLAQGGLADLLEVHLRYTSSSYADVSFAPSALLARLREQTYADTFHISPGGVIPLLCLAPLVAAGLWNRRHNGDTGRGLALWLGVALLAVAVQGRFFAYHWYPVYPPAVALATLGFADWLASSARRSAGRKLAAVAAAATFAAFALYSPIRESWRTVRYLAGDLTQDDYFSKFHVGYNARDVAQVTRHLRAQARPGDRLFVWGHEATVIYLSGLESSSRFVFSLPLAEPGPFRDRYRAEAMAELQARPPRFVLAGASYGFEEPDKAGFLRDFPELERFLHARYRHRASFGELDLYELTGADQ